MVKWKWQKSHTIFLRENKHLVYLFTYLTNFHYGDKNSETTKARNLKFGDMISLYMKLCTSNFGGATSLGLGQMRPKHVIAKFIVILVAYARVLPWLNDLRRQCLKPKT